MAITHIGTEFVHNPAGGTLDDHFVPVPAGTQDGDYMVLTAYGPQPPAIGPITGWTNIDANNASTVLKYNIYHRIASSEPASWEVVSTTADIRGSSISVFRGVDTSSLAAALDDNSVNVNTSSSDPISADTVTIGTTGTVVFTARATRGSSAVQCRHSSSDTELADYGQDNGVTTRDACLYLSGIKAVGTTPALSISLTGGAGTHSVTYALAMAPPGEGVAVDTTGVTATANSPTVTTFSNISAPAGTATGVTVTGNNATVTTTTNTNAPAGFATGVTVTANDATVSTVSNVNAPAGEATGVTATAEQPTVSTPGSHQAPGGTATATATANDPTVTANDGIRNANAPHVSVFASAFDATTTAPAPGAILPTNADWNIWIDWDKDLGVNLTSFETGTTEGWVGVGDPAPTLSVGDEAPAWPVKHGRKSMKISWAVATGPTVERILTGLVIGRQYTASAWVFVPSSSHPDLRLQCNGTNGSFSTALNQWTQITVTFTATATQHTLVIDPETDPNAGTDEAYVETVQLTHSTEPVDDLVLGTRQSLSFKYGRDTARSLEAMSPTEATFELDNRDLELSPDNPSSPYNPYLVPGRPIYVRADFDDRFYSMFYGYLESYTVKPGVEDDSVEFGAQDMLSQLADFTLDTEVYPSLQTGDAIAVVLDEMGWPEHRRSLDRGATTVSWWSESATDALEAVKKLVDSEGLPAFAYVDRHGNFVFRDRHHRYLDDRSLTSQASFAGASGSEPQFCEPFDYDLGWTDLLNQVDFEIEVRQPRPLEEVFAMDEEQVIQLNAGEPYVLDVEGNDPFIQALTPRGGTVVVNDSPSGGEAGEEEEEVFDPPTADYIVRSGSGVTATLDRTSGATCKITFFSSGNAVISNVRLRARPIQTVQTLRVKAEDPASVSAYGPRTYDGEAPWANIHDADAIARTIVGTRAERLPIVSFTVNSGNETRYLQVLERDLSDRIHLTEGKTFIDHDFYIESVEHNIDEVGWDHRATFSCERVRDLPVANVFEFGSSTADFDNGVFGGIGFVDPADQFVLGTSQLNNEKLTQ